MAKNIKKIIPYIFSLITGKPRYLPNIKWSSCSMIHNIFRVYEMIFWRKVGIRAENASEVWTDEKGKKLGEQYWFFTWEALLAHYEQVFYQYIKNLFSFRFEWIPIAIPAFVGIPVYKQKNLIPIGYFAIAFDAVTQATGAPTTEVTVSHTCTGSDLLLITGFFSGNTSVSVTYAAVSLTSIDKQVGGTEEVSLWYLIAPTTGANNVVATQTSSAVMRVHNVSYTGTKQSGVPDASSKQTLTSVTEITGTLTTIADNCWTVMMVRSDSDTVNAGTGSTLRGAASTSGIFDSNAAITPAGSTSMTVTCPTSGRLTDVMASFAPVAAQTPDTPPQPPQIISW